MLEGKLQGEFYGGETPDLADLTVHVLTNMILTDDFTHVPAAYLDDYPKIKEHSARVRGSALVAEYLAVYPN